MKNWIVAGAFGVVGLVVVAVDGETKTTVVHPVEIQSKLFISLFDKEATIEQSALRMESYLNPYSMIVVDKELNQYASFAANNMTLKWEAGFALQKSDGTTYLCESKTFEIDSCIRIYEFTKHGLSKSPIV